MAATTERKPGKLYWIITGLLVLWGLMGLWVFYDFTAATPESMAKYVADGTYTQAYADYYTSGSPLWHTVVFAIAVISGALGALGLLLCRAWAVPLYIVSLLCIIISLFSMFGLDKLHTVMSGGQIAMQGVVLALGLFSAWFARKKKAKGWLK